jgi:ATP-dependent DNA ligase
MKKTFETLYKIDTTGKMRQWSISCDDSDIHPRYVQEHGVVGGKMQTTSTYVSAGKNMGRANETSSWEQCVADAQSLWNKKRDRNGYATEQKQAAVNVVSKVKPMLAKSYNASGSDLSVLKDGHKIKFPCYAQPKLDGIRCLALVQSCGSVVLYSRQNKVWTSLTHISDAVEKLNLPAGTVLDGELYVHGEEFQKLTSAIKRDKPSADTTKVEYHIYDMFSHEGYKDRYETLCQYFNATTWPKCLQLVPSYIVETRDAVDDLHDELVALGYEGIMLRNYDGPYKVGGRSADLQKVKKFLDMEFEIVGAYENKGKQAGQCTLECVTGDGTVFGVKPEGSEAVREQYWKDWQAGKLKGKLLTVRFFSWTTSKNPVPRFPVGIAVRDYE